MYLRRFQPLHAVLAVAALAGALAAAPSATAQGAPIEGSYIVVYKKSVDSVPAETVARERRLGFKSKHRFRRALEGFSAKLSPTQLKRLRSDPEVAYVSQNRRVNATAPVALLGGDSTPSGVRRILAGTTTAARQASGISVAVIDTGIKLSHPDLNAVSGTNCISPGSPADDDNGHGTHVAGTIAAKNDGSGVVGVAPGTKTYAVKVLNSAGSGSTASVVCGIDWVTANHDGLDIDVANMSLGGGGPPVAGCASTTDAEHAAICNSTAAGVNYVVAAGNDGWDFDYAPVPDVPAAYPEVFTVSALTDSDGNPGGTGPAPSCSPSQSDDTPASFSNFALTTAGAAHTIAAPGVCITSTWNDGGYDTISGTSMASPHMAGVVARCMNEGGVSGPCSTRTPAQVISYLRTQALTHNTANPAYGFTGDPNSQGTEFYGFLTGPFPEPASQPGKPIASGAGGSAGSTFPNAGGGGQAAVAAPGRATSHGARSFKRLRRGRFTYSFRAGAGLRGSASFASIGKVKVSARRRVTLARKSFTVPGSGKVTLRIKLSKKNLRILRRNRRIKLRVTVNLRSASGLTSIATSTLTLRI